MSKKKLSKSTRAFIDELAAEADLLERERDQAQARFEVASQNLQAMSDFVNTVFHELESLRIKAQADGLIIAALRDEVAGSHPECQSCRQPVKHLYEHWSTRCQEYYCNEFDRAPAVHIAPDETEVERVLRKFQETSRVRAGELTDEEINAEYVSKEVDDILVLPWEPTDDAF